MANAEFELVIFDSDGVLIDSEPLINEVLAELISELGLPCTADQAAKRFKGVSGQDIVHAVETELAITLDVDEMQTLFEERAFKVFERDLLPIPGVLTVLNEMPLPYCTATNAVRSEAEFKLRVAGLLPWFSNRIFSVDQVANGKPEPDLYLLAAREMHVSPERCLVIEDSLHGIRAARSAGMSVIGLAASAHTDADELRAAGVDVMSDIRELLGLL